jgi:hypothetical protein
MTLPLASVMSWPVAGSAASQSAPTSAEAPGPAAAICACRSAYCWATAAARPAGSPGNDGDGPPCQLPPSQPVMRWNPPFSPVARSIEPLESWSGQRGADTCGSP